MLDAEIQRVKEQADKIEAELERDGIEVSPRDGP